MANALPLVVNLTFAQGETLEQHVFVFFNADNTPFDLTGASARLTAKALPTDSTAALDLTSAGGTLVIDAVAGTITPSVPSGTTAALAAPQMLLFQFKLTLADGSVHITHRGTLTVLPDLTATGTDSGGGTVTGEGFPLTGDGNAAGHKITNLGAPSAAGDAANRGYVDGAYTAGTGLTLASGQFAVAYGTSGTTAAAGNDSRLTGALQAPASPAQGDVLYYNGTTWTRLGAGTSGQVLQTGGAAANPSWATVAGGGGLASVSHDGSLSGNGTSGTPLAVVFGTTAGTAAQGNDGRITGAVQTTRQINTTAPLAGGGTLSGDLTLSIAAASGTVAGSMSAADKSKLDGVASGATATPLGTATPQNLGTAAAGTATNASREDHVHALPTASQVGALGATAAASGDLAGSYPAPTVKGITLGADAQGDVYYRSATGLARLGAGTSGNVLQTNGASANPSWVTPFTAVAHDGSLSGSGTSGSNLVVVYGTTAGTATQGNDTRVANAVQTSRQVLAGTGLTGGGDLSADRTLTVAYGTIAGTATQGNDTRVANAVQTSRQVLAGTGLTGGGALSSDVTLTVAYGTSTGTALQGTQDALYVHLAGTETVTGSKTFTAAPVVSVTDATTSAVTDVVTMTHLTSGTAAAGIAAGHKFQAQNASGSTVDVARLAGTLTNATAGAEDGAVDVSTRTAGATLAQNYRFGGDGGLLIGTTTALANVGLGLPNAKYLWSRNAAGSSWLQVAGTDASNNVTFGSGLAAMILQTSGSLQVSSASSTRFAFNSSAEFVVGNNAQGGTNNPGAGIVRAPTGASGSNVAGATLTLKGGIGTGTGAATYVSLQAGVPTTAGSSAQSYAESFRAYGQYVEFTAGEVINAQTTKTSAYTVVATDRYVPTNTTGGAFTVTLPAANAVPNGWTVTFKDESNICGTNNLTVAAAGTDTIEGSASKTIAANYGALTLRSNGASLWLITGKV